MISAGLFGVAARHFGGSAGFAGAPGTIEANTAARRLYESMGAGLATQGPTVNYWFALA
jgi:hypothetical protein